MRGFVLASLLAFSVAGCDDQQKAVEKQKADTAAADARAAARSAAKEAEQKAMAEPQQAFAVLERRLEEWILQNSNGVVVVAINSGTRSFRLFSLQSSSPWLVECGVAGITVSIGTFVEGDKDETANSVSKNITVLD